MALRPSEPPLRGAVSSIVQHPRAECKNLRKMRRCQAKKCEQARRIAPGYFHALALDESKLATINRGLEGCARVCQLCVDLIRTRGELW